MGFFVNGMLGGYGALISELYPTVGARHCAERSVQCRTGGRRLRSGGGRRRGEHYSFESAIALLAALYVLDILALWLLIPERRGAALS